MSMKPKVG